MRFTGSFGLALPLNMVLFDERISLCSCASALYIKSILRVLIIESDSVRR
jgi:hypothetical protein